LSGYACEPLAGCVYRYRAVSIRRARALALPFHAPHIIEMVAWPHGQRPEHRGYYALDLPQAVAKATELTVRLRRQQISAKLIAIRPATDSETNAFFAELAHYDGVTPPRCILRCRP
jgi:hypothetical protein